MPSVRLSASETRKLDEARRVRQSRSGKPLSRARTIEALADLALRHPQEFGVWVAKQSALARDPLLDPNIGFHLGKTDASTVDEVLYGKPRRR